MNKKKLIIGGSAAGVILVAAIFGFVFLKGHSSGSSAVSYTHLDVYKRQAWSTSRTSPASRAEKTKN